MRIYPVERYITIGEEKVLFGDGSHILYVNGKYRGDDEVGKLMHDFSCTDPDDMNYEILAHPPGDRGRTGAAEKEDVDGDEGWFVKRRGVSSRRAGCPFCLEEKSELEL